MDEEASWNPRPRIGDEPPPDERSDQPEAAPDDDAGVPVLLELSGRDAPHAVAAMSIARRLPGFRVDEEYGAIPLAASGSMVVRGHLRDMDEAAALEAREDVVRVWRDTPIAPF